MAPLNEQNFSSRAKTANDALKNCIDKAREDGIIYDYTRIDGDEDVAGIDAEIVFGDYWATTLGTKKLKVQIKNRFDSGDDAEIELIHDTINHFDFTKKEYSIIYSRKEYIADKSLKPSVGRDIDGIKKKKFDCFLWFDRAQSNAYLFKIDTIADYITKFETAVDEHLLSLPHTSVYKNPNENKFLLAFNNGLKEVNMPEYGLEGLMIQKSTNNLLLYVPCKLADLQHRFRPYRKQNDPQ